MIGVDTNVLARVFALDDEKQRETALRFLSDRSPDDPAFVSVVVVVGLIWVLQEAYGFSTEAISTALDWLLDSTNVVVEQQQLLRAAVSLATSRNADIADCIIAALSAEAGAIKTMTFDKPAAKRVPGMELLK